jgi:uncharacterized protein YueI
MKRAQRIHFYLQLAKALHTPFAESANLEHLSSVALAKDEAINANLRGLGYGG